MKTNKIVTAKCTASSFFRAWVEFLTPYHKLTPRERDVAARIIAQRYHLLSSISDPEVLKEVMWSQTSRKDMRDSLGMSSAQFQMILATLREHDFLVDGDVNPRYIPHLTDEPRFLLSVLFDWSSPTNPVNNESK